jgi:ribosomal protein L11 methyltransferase
MVKQEKYLELQIIYNKENYETIYNNLYISGVDSILEDDKCLRIYFPQDKKKEIEELMSILREKTGLNKDKLILNKIETRNWNKEWEDSIEPIYLKDKIIIYPSWKKNKLINPNNKVLIEIDPKMSFGTGHNETTQLVLDFLIDEIDEEDKYMLDYGCGTGILTICSIKLGIEKAVALDIDEDSIKNAKENFKVNGVGKNVKLIKANISEIKESRFDIICANIIRSVIEENLGSIYDKLKTGGKLFISGVLDTEEEKIRFILENKGFELKQINYKSEWLGIYASKR